MKVIIDYKLFNNTLSAELNGYIKNSNVGGDTPYLYNVCPEPTFLRMNDGTRPTKLSKEPFWKMQA